MDFGNIIARVNKYKQILQNTEDYRMQWHNQIKPMLEATLGKFLESAALPKAKVIVRDNIENLEAVILDLGNSSSGISENIENTEIKRIMIKSNGSLIYQQLFNGKIMVMLQSPNIEGYGQPKPPFPLEILRPDELTNPFILRHLELFLKDITDWEDFDDDQPQKPNAIGFTPSGYEYHGGEE
ncbi:MAG: hypothetical protein LC107_05190 [Chitinophagales bacterium]|nr:hypothetical protein [Chitinophagales bacterium]